MDMNKFFTESAEDSKVNPEDVELEFVKTIENIDKWNVYKYKINDKIIDFTDRYDDLYDQKYKVLDTGNTYYEHKEIVRRLEADRELRTLQLEIKKRENAVKFMDTTIKALDSKNYILNNYTKYIQYTRGYTEN